MIKTNKNSKPQYLNIDHEIVVSDPLYLFDKENSISIDEMKPGKYVCSYFIDRGEKRCWSIEMHHIDTNHDKNSSEWKFYDRVWVDTALAGFFNLQDNPQEEIKNFLNKENSRQLVYINDKIGFYASSGYGDGEYPVFCIYENDEITALKINFY